jgi:uncharacterized protein (DUF1501 family)
MAAILVPLPKEANDKCIVNVLQHGGYDTHANQEYLKNAVQN